MDERACGGLTLVETTVEIAAEPAQAYAFATTPALWHSWHPATASVSHVPPRPLVAGETVLEHIRAGGRRFDALWVVTACEAPREWVIETDSAEGSARIRYRIEPVDGGCRFTRTLGFRSKRYPWRLLDGTLVRWILDRQSTRALQALKRALERGEGARAPA